jgi:hypothetical protein
MSRYLSVRNGQLIFIAIHTVIWTISYKNDSTQI